MSLFGPNDIIGEIYSSGWNHCHETYENSITLKPLENPDIIYGTIVYLGIEYDIVYNEIEIQYFDTVKLDYRLVYIPKDGYTTTIILYMSPDIFVRDNNEILFNKTIRGQCGEIQEITIKLLLSDNAINQIFYNRQTDVNMNTVLLKDMEITELKNMNNKLVNELIRLKERLDNEENSLKK